jgi:chemotaxis regulatin CheY-phosphate phosphatase CheZ
MSGQSGEATHMLEEILGSLKREFDPASITMTSTNIPDAIIKLSSVLVETSEATTKVFQLVEKHHA